MSNEQKVSPLKIRCHIYFVMKKVIILRKIHVAMKIFAPPILNHFNLNLNRKKRVVMRAMRKKLNIFKLHIYASADDLLHIRIGNLDWCKCGHFKTETREIDCLCCIEVDAMLISSVKILECE